MASTPADRRAAAAANGSAAAGSGGGEVVVDYDSLTVGEINLIEDVCDADLDDIKAGKVRKGKMLRAFALIGLRRTNPDATLADADAATVVGLEAMLGERPTGAAGPPATPSSASSPRRAGSRSSGSRN